MGGPGGHPVTDVAKDGAAAEIDGRGSSILTSISLSIQAGHSKWYTVSPDFHLILVDLYMGGPGGHPVTDVHSK